jgi:hypothetical protein
VPIAVAAVTVAVVLVAAAPAALAAVSASGILKGTVRKVVKHHIFNRDINTMRGPPVISWWISPSNYSYKYHKP